MSYAVELGNTVFEIDVCWKRMKAKNYTMHA